MKILVSSALLALTLCAAPAWALPASPAQRLAQEHRAGFEGDSSKISVDWNGTYRGVLPCQDCRGVEMTLTLRSDHTYVMVRTELKKKGTVKRVEGRFGWRADGSSILLNDTGDGPSLLKVGENQILVLDDDGQVVVGRFAEDFVLKKVGEAVTTALESTRWELVELGGATVPDPTDGMKRPHFVLGADGRISGHAGCNGFSGKYEKKGEGRFDLSELISTMMACPQMETESRFLSALETADRYQIAGSTLFLYEGEAMVAQLRAASNSKD